MVLRILSRFVLFITPATFGIDIYNVQLLNGKQISLDKVLYRVQTRDTPAYYVTIALQA